MTREELELLIDIHDLTTLFFVIHTPSVVISQFKFSFDRRYGHTPLNRDTRVTVVSISICNLYFAQHASSTPTIV